MSVVRMGVMRMGVVRMGVMRMGAVRREGKGREAWGERQDIGWSIWSSRKGYTREPGGLATAHWR